MTALIHTLPDQNIEFKRPFSTGPNTQLVTIQNISAFPIAFKVKTTSPKQYSVRPTSGKLEPGKSIQLQVLLQMMKEEPPEDFKSKDKFLVQAIKMSRDDFSLEGESLNSKLVELWTMAEQLKKETHSTEEANAILDEIKLKCLFLPSDAKPSPFESQSQRFNSSDHSPLSAPVHSNSTKPVSFNSNEKEIYEYKDSIQKLNLACQGYKAEIDRLNSLRQRKVGSDLSNIPLVSRPTMQFSHHGVSIQVLLIAMFLSFLFGVLFF